MEDQLLVYLRSLLDGGSDVDDIDFTEDAKPMTLYPKIKPPRMLSISVDWNGMCIPINIMSNSRK